MEGTRVSLIYKLDVAFAMHIVLDLTGWSMGIKCLRGKIGMCMNLDAAALSISVNRVAMRVSFSRLGERLGNILNAAQ